MQEPWLADHDGSLPKIHIGICAMDKKAHSRPMNAIVERLEAYGEFDIKYFGDETILHKPITQWPTCDCLLSWHSDGFPLAKVPILILRHLLHSIRVEICEGMQSCYKQATVLVCCNLLVLACRHRSMRHSGNLTSSMT